MRFWRLLCFLIMTISLRKVQMHNNKFAYCLVQAISWWVKDDSITAMLWQSTRRRWCVILAVYERCTVEPNCTHFSSDTRTQYTILTVYCKTHHRTCKDYDYACHSTHSADIYTRLCVMRKNWLMYTKRPNIPARQRRFDQRRKNYGNMPYGETHYVIF